MKYIISPAVHRNQIFAEKIYYIKKYLPGKFASGNIFYLQLDFGNPSIYPHAGKNGRIKDNILLHYVLKCIKITLLEL